MVSFINTCCLKIRGKSIFSESVKSKHKVDVSQRILKRLTSGTLSKNKKQLVQDFNRITPEQLNDVLNSYFQDTTAKVMGEDPIKVVEKFQPTLC